MATSAHAATGLVATVVDFDAVYERWFPDVCRWLHALGIPRSDLEDLAQEVFIIVNRKLGRFDGAHLSSWLFRIASRVASDHRRRAWFKNLFGRRKEDAVLEDLETQTPDPAQALERRDRQRMVMRILDGMSERHRVTFALFEIEGYSGDEIAELQRIPLKTVWTRLHYARKDFLARLALVTARNGEAP